MPRARREALFGSPSFRYIAAVILLAAGAVLVIEPLANRLTLWLSLVTSRWNLDASAERWYGQFGVGLLLGLVWLPCVGPTLGAAIGLASMGQQMGLAFLVMLMFGADTAAVLLAAGLLSSRAIARWNATAMESADHGKRLLEDSCSPASTRSCRPGRCRCCPLG